MSSSSKRAGVWTFTIYWTLKSYELSLSRLESEPETALVHAKNRREMKGKEAKDVHV